MAGSTLISDRRQLGSPSNSLPAPGAEPEIPSAKQNDLWIFRDGRKLVSGPDMVRDLGRRISASNGSALLDALIEAGELEAALADADCPDAAIAAEVTDILAWDLSSGEESRGTASQLTSRIHPPELIAFSPPEGFSYYALHPLDFAQITSRISAEPLLCALIGIRSIGTTLSAVCAAALKSTGRPVSRITVRPTGHPYSRRTDFTAQQLQWIHAHLLRHAQFLIVDEGPGRSGSTFLSVAEALQAVGVPNHRMTILGSRQPDPAALCAEGAVARWNSFRFISTTPSVNQRFEGCAYIGGGSWRTFVFPSVQDWPECWTEMERLKFLSADRKRLFKFEGMGPVRTDLRQRAFVLADAGFSPRAYDAGNGFLEYEKLEGRVMHIEDLSSSVLDRMARYCAFRVSHFPAQQDSVGDFRHMLEFNVQQEFGVDLNLPEASLASEHPVLVDGRMQPYEWIATGPVTFLKTDGISHGDDHFFPGPCDIGWDLAGIAVEWHLNADARHYLLNGFLKQTGRDVSREILLYMLAYSVFRLGFCKMAISTVRGSDEEQRMRTAYTRYRTLAASLLQEFTRGTSTLTSAA
jgi:hypothetical protein